ncbi:MAG: sulfotransferase family 2 domain-containing protein [Phycisphaerae bacterium]|nr:sulfotransferase family 2 domain-containing protein [Phycisphaerae bacterium]
MIVSIHIPKTAGTTFGELLARARQGRVFYDYHSYEYGRGYTYSAEHGRRLREGRAFIEHFFDVIHGHFFQSQYAQLFPSARYVTCLRDPIRRLVSHYRHYLSYSGRTDLGLIAFARQKYVRNMQYQFLAGRDIEDFAHVLITERFAESVRLMAEKFPELGLGAETLGAIPWRNRGRNRPAPAVNPGRLTRLVLRVLLRKEYRLYRRALRRHRREMQSFLPGRSPGNGASGDGAGQAAAPRAGGGPRPAAR